MDEAVECVDGAAGVVWCGDVVCRGVVVCVALGGGGRGPAEVGAGAGVSGADLSDGVLVDGAAGGGASVVAGAEAGTLSGGCCWFGKGRC